MPSTTDFSDFCAGTLASRLLTAATSGAVVTAQDINGSPITWPTGAHRLKFVSKTRTGTSVETIGVASASQSGSTVTLGTLTRQLSLTDGSVFTSGGSGYTFPANTKVYLTWDVFDAERTMKDDKVNTLTGSGAIRSSSTTTPIIRLNNVTTAQRTAMSPSNGDLVYDTDLGQSYQYVGGAWTAIGDTGTSDGSATVAGKFEEATVAEQGTASATGGTGARLVPAVANLVKTSSGAGDENKLAVLNSAGQWASGFLGTGSASSSNYLLGDRTWGTVPSLADKLFGTGTDGAPAWTSGASLNPSTEKQYTTATIPSGQTVTVSSVNVPLVIHNTGDVTINGTLDLNGKGGAGGGGGARCTTVSCTATAGSAGTAGASLVAGLTTTNGSAGGVKAGGGNAGGGGGGASIFSAGSTGSTGTSSGGTGGSGGSLLTAGQAAIFAFLSNLFRAVVCGGGGGGGGGGGRDGGSTANSFTGGDGGAGGGAVVWMIGGNLTLGASSIIRANGAAGSAASLGTDGYSGGGGGGGGGGTIVILVAGTITNGGVTLSASGGAAGSGTGTTSGGAGADGKAIIYSLSTGTLITA